MNWGRVSLKARIGGYTILETMIFLAASALMFLIAVQFVGGKTNKANFVNTVRDFETRLTDIANDISTGYYQGGNSFGCDKLGPGGTPRITDTGVSGSSVDCIFAGTVLKFGTGGDRARMVQYTAAGLRLDRVSGFPVSSLAQAIPTISSDPVLADRAFKVSNIGYGLTVQCVAPGSSCAPTSRTNAAFGFFARLGDATSKSGSNVQTDLIYYAPSSIDDSPSVDADSSRINMQSIYTAPGAINPPNGITICLTGGNTNQYALIHVGATGNKLTVSNEIGSISGANLCTVV